MGTVVKGRVTKKGSPVGSNVHKTLLADLVRVQISVPPSCTSIKEVGLMVAVTIKNNKLLLNTSALGTAPRSPSPFIDQKCEKTFGKQIIRSVGRTERHNLFYYAKGGID